MVDSDNVQIRNSLRLMT